MAAKTHYVRSTHVNQLKIATGTTNSSQPWWAC